MKQNYLLYTLLILFVCLFSSCITNKQKRYLQAEGSYKEYSQVPFEQYTLNVNDEIIYYLMTTSERTQRFYNSFQGGQNGNINSTGNTQAYRIYDDGCIIVPTVGKIKIAGLTLREAEIEITQNFKKIVTDAEVKISLVNNYFYVQGDGGKGQFYIYKNNITIFEAMALAGDITSMGDKKHVKVIRRGDDGVDHIQTFDLRKESIIDSEYYYVRPNDLIYIPTNPNSFFRIESVSSFISMFVAPISLLVMVVSLF